MSDLDWADNLRITTLNDPEREVVRIAVQFFAALEVSEVDDSELQDIVSAATSLADTKPAEIRTTHVLAVLRDNRRTRG